MCPGGGRGKVRERLRKKKRKTADFDDSRVKGEIVTSPILIRLSITSLWEKPACEGLRNERR